MRAFFLLLPYLGLLAFLPLSLQWPLSGPSSTEERELDARSKPPVPFCQQPVVKEAEWFFKQLPNHEGASLCSSVLHKYATTTSEFISCSQEVVDLNKAITTLTGTTVIPQITDEATTLAQSTTTTTTTTTQISDATTTTTSTSTLTITTGVTLPPAVILTTPINLASKRGSPPPPNCTSRLASILHIASSLVSAFCSCEAPGPTSTTTLTHTTSTRLTLSPLQTSFTTTVTPPAAVETSTSTFLTTTTVTTVTEAASTTLDVLATPTPFFLQIQGGNYDGQYISDPNDHPYLLVSPSPLDAVELYVDPVTHYIFKVATGEVIEANFDGIFFPQSVAVAYLLVRPPDPDDEAGSSPTCSVQPSPDGVSDPRGILNCALNDGQGDEYTQFAIDDNTAYTFPVLADSGSKYPNNLTAVTFVQLRTILELPVLPVAT